MFYLAAVLFTAIAVAHSILGEKYILVRLFRIGNLPKLFGDTRFTKRTLRFAWHITSVAWCGFAAMLLQLGHGQLTSASVLEIIGYTAIASGLLPLIITRGKHLSWVVFLAIGGITLYLSTVQPAASVHFRPWPERNGTSPSIATEGNE